MIDFKLFNNKFDFLMMKIIKNVFIFILVSFLNIIGVFANEINFVVDNIQVEKISTTGKEAKDIAIIEGQRKGLATVFERLGLKKENLKFISNDILSQMVDSIQISDEVISSTKYSGMLLINFNQEFIDFYVKQLGMKVGQVLPTKYLYIPIFKNGDSYMLLSDENTWRNATVDAILENKYNHIILLNNNPANEALIKKDKIDNPNYNDFSSILKNQGANVVMFSIVEYKKETDVLEINLKELNAEELKEINLNLFNKEKLTYEGLFADGANKVLIYIKNMLEKNTNNNAENSNKDNNINAENQGLNENIMQFEASLLFTDLNELNFFKEVLKSLSFIENYKIKSISTKEMVVDIKLNVYLEEAYNLFKEQNILMKLKDNKYYLIYLDD